MDLVDLAQLEPHGPDTYVGVGPRYHWGGLYGGQIVAQGLVAAANTVDPAFRAHSLHAYFIRRGDPTQPVRYEVDRLRDGRSFATRAVVARQSGGAILNMSASFQVGEEAYDAQAAVMPWVHQPDDLVEENWTEMYERKAVPFRHENRIQAWMRATGLGEDPVVHAAALAFMSDDLPSDAVRALHPQAGSDDGGGEWFGTSLDHAIWFHRPLRADAWLLHDFSCSGLLNSRGLATGHVFDRDGTHLATVTQEVLLRRRRPTAD